MRILALADTPPTCDLPSTIGAVRPDVIVTLGDMSSWAITSLRDCGVPVLSVQGNHCDGTYIEDLGFTDLHLKMLSLGGITLGGFEGCVRYKPAGWFQYTQQEAEEMLADFPSVDVMLCHCPPYGVHDDPEDDVHVGFHALRRYLHRARPKYLLHGHTYPQGRMSDDQPQLVVSTVDATHVIYVHDWAVFDLPV